ncbi:MAG: sugar transferase, partial [Candidatus Cloacimonadales bacterium]
NQTYRFHKDNPSFAKTTIITKSKKLEEEGSTYEIGKFDSSDKVPASPFKVDKNYCLDTDTGSNSIKSLLQTKYFKDQDSAFDFLNEHLDLNCFCKNKSYIINSHSIFNIENLDPESQSLFINLHKANNFRRINKYIIQVNENLTQGGVFCGCMETKNQRRRRFVKKYTLVLGNIIYFIDFIVRRVFPKLALLKGLYFAITKGKNRVFSETEFLGRLYFCGFELLAKREIEGINYFIAIKTKEPCRDENPSYGPIIQLKRKGKNGKLLMVNKFRTMHPYSEYLQDYVYKTCSLQEGGKFKDDFRVTSWGRVFRKLWIDELPQFINLFKGELNLVGVRALSEHYFSLYPEDVRILRVQVKPGLLPPFYADMPKSFEEIVESERKYLEQKIKRPVWTDFKYFWLVLWNIVVKKARSN